MNRISLSVIRQFSCITVVVFTCCLYSCKKDESSDKDMITYVFEALKNPGLVNDIHADIRNDSIVATLPAKTDVSGLVATFTHSGTGVTVGGIVQSSGVTANDFSFPLKYIVKAGDNSTRTYKARFKLATDNDNTITKFEFKKSLNSALAKDVVAIIRNDSIIADFPLNMPVTSLTPAYTTAAAGVTVNNVKQTSGVTRNNFTATVEYLVRATNGETRTYKAVARVEHSFTGFKIRKALNTGLSEDIIFSVDLTGKIMEATHLKWIDSPAPSKFIVNFETGNARVTVGDTEVQNGVTVIDFGQPLQITTTSGNYAPRSYATSIICPQINATLPVLRIEADGPITSKENYVTAKLEILGNGINEGLWNFNKEKIEIRLRGNSTMGLPKKPYRIKFPEKYSPLGLNHAKEKSWVLLANDCDKSLIRNAVAFQMSRILSADAATPRFTACTKFVDVYLNGTYEGNYHLTDQVEVATGRVDVKSLKASDAGNPSKISGGYLLELDGFARSEPLYFETPKQLLVTVKYPKDDDYAPEQATWITNYFTAAENALFSADFKNAATGWRKYIDQASWVDYCIINELAGNSDAWWSTYMSKERNVDYFAVGPVWDFDIAFNNDNRINNATYSLMSQVAHDPKTWINRFMQDETFKAAIKARWNVRKGELSGLKTYMDELATQINMSQKANFKRWDITRQALGHAMPAPTSYEAALNQLKNYFQARYNYLDTEFNKW